MVSHARSAPSAIPRPTGPIPRWPALSTRSSYGPPVRRAGVLVRRQTFIIWPASTVPCPRASGRRRCPSVSQRWGT